MFMKTQALSIPVGTEVAAFAAVMETKLQLEGYDKVETWGNIPLRKLIDQLCLKAKRLEAADPANAPEIFSRAVALGNLAMMIAEVAARSRETVSSKNPTVVPEKDAQIESNVNKSNTNEGISVAAVTASSPRRTVMPRPFRPVQNVTRRMD